MYKGPVPRSHAHELPKKVRALGLKHALSSKVKSGAFVVVDSVSLDDHKTKALRAKIAKLGWGRTLLIDGTEPNENFVRAASNIPEFDVLPSQGANVYDIIRRDTLVVTRAGVDALTARLAGATVAAEG